MRHGAVRSAEPDRPDAGSRQSPFRGAATTKWLGPVIAGTLAAATAARTLSGRLALVRVVGGSMEPTFADGDRLLVRRAATHRRGDVIVFRNPVVFPDGVADPPWLVKRVTAVEGDAVPEDVLAAVGAVGPSKVPAGGIVVRGDAERSQDSRHFGYVATQAVLGVVLRPL